MRNLGTATLAALQSGTVVSRILVWVEARNRLTGATEALGLWTGGDHAQITVDGSPRTYYGAGNLIDLPPVTYKVGLDVQVYRLGITSISTEARQLIRASDPRFAPVQIHRALFDPATRVLIDPPHQVLSGFVDEVEFPRPPAGGEATCYINVVTSARQLTFSLPNKNSDSNQRRISGDLFLRHADATADVWWGAQSGGGQ